MCAERAHAVLKVWAKRSSETITTVSDGLSFNKSPQQSDKSNPPPHPYRQHVRQNDYPKRRGYHPQRCAAYRQRRTGRYAQPAYRKRSRHWNLSEQTAKCRRTSYRRLRIQCKRQLQPKQSQSRPCLGNRAKRYLCRRRRLSNQSQR